MIIPRAREKWIEVALLLHAINKAAVREAPVRFGHPSTLLPWRARPPLAAARAVVLPQMVDALSSDAAVPPLEEPRGPRRRLNPVETLIIEGMLPVESRVADIDAPKQPGWWRATCQPGAVACHLLSKFRRAGTSVLLAARI